MKFVISRTSGQRPNVPGVVEENYMTSYVGRPNVEVTRYVIEIETLEQLLEIRKYVEERFLPEDNEIVITQHQGFYAGGVSYPEIELYDSYRE